ncbi:phosphatidate cytidylyltransferase [Coxiella endosymbiont of Amblyomma nuttalli]|uniref:phosphatidate cytidylyltransferase n=1 Tax=Coxiella endosymbiont of Amblyomma nuttalli TaxID=2749996 RepID=UPI001BB58F4B|nr:phosphatidate cytidylyltransferase [Coxiella endosymbiont of Amblyomma nuttalli]QTS83704.1 Phosphatidate cytidylyltransferase [Coxiella endosymbiont of Amblyomma nuttalli]
MFEHRFLTLLVLIPIILLAIEFLPMPWFAILVGVVIAWAAWEWTRLIGIINHYSRGLYVLLIALALWAVYYLSVFWILAASLVIWIWIAAAIFCYALGFAPLGFQYSMIKIVVGFFTLVPCWLAITVSHENVGGPGWLLFGFTVVWTMDTGAYVAGRWLGKHTLITRVSPKKTWEGLLGGIISTFLIVAVACVIFHLPFSHVFRFYLLTLFTIVFAVIGDLFESMIKRQAGVKDSGQLLPGHGGILDRIDSVIAALPVFVLCSLLIDYIHQ